MLTEIKVIPVSDKIRKMADLSATTEWLSKNFTSFFREASLDAMKIMNHINLGHRIDTIAMGLQVFRHGTRGFISPFINEMNKFKETLVALKAAAPALEKLYVDTIDSAIGDIDEVLSIFDKPAEKPLEPIDGVVVEDTKV